MTAASQSHCRELVALRQDVEGLRSQQEADRLAFAGILSDLQDQLDQLRRDLGDERRFRQSLTGRFNSMEYVS